MHPLSHLISADPVLPLVPAQSSHFDLTRPEPWALLSSAIVDEPGQVAELRAALRAGLAGQGVDADTADDLTLVLSELVGNGLRHGEPPLHLVATMRGDRTRIQVTDGGRRTLQVEDVDSLGEGGRGLGIIAALSDDWGLEHLPGRGTVAWAERRIRARP
jgi:anti-sigma regulatory factor (Ser/Thr protein kinase)